MDKRGEDGSSITGQSVKNFLSHSTEKFRVGTFLCFTKFLVSKNFMEKRLGKKEGGVSRYSVKIFLSHSTEKLRRGTFLFYTKFLVSKYFMDTRWGVKGEECHEILSEIYSLRVPKNFVGEHFCFLHLFCYRKTSLLRGGE